MTLERWNHGGGSIRNALVILDINVARLNVHNAGQHCAPREKTIRDGFSQPSRFLHYSVCIYSAP